MRKDAVGRGIAQTPKGFKNARKSAPLGNEKPTELVSGIFFIKRR